MRAEVSNWELVLWSRYHTRRAQEAELENKRAGG